ncbi:hypothetical protein ACB092_05G122700 [Castanea dentata]
MDFKVSSGRGGENNIYIKGVRKFEFKNRVLFECLAKPSHFDSSFSNPLLQRAPQRISKTNPHIQSLSFTENHNVSVQSKKHQEAPKIRFRR